MDCEHASSVASNSHNDALSLECSAHVLDMNDEVHSSLVRLHNLQSCIEVEPIVHVLFDDGHVGSDMFKDA